MTKRFNSSPLCQNVISLAWSGFALMPSALVCRRFDDEGVILEIMIDYVCMLLEDF